MMFFEDNKRDIVIATIVLVVAGFIYGLLVVPRNSHLADTRERIKQVDLQIMSSSMSVSEMTTLLEADSTADLVFSHEEQDLLPDLLEQIAALGQRNGVNVVSMRPGVPWSEEINQDEGFGFQAESIRLTVAVKVSARYRALGEFLKAMESIPILVAIQDLNISSATNGSADLTATFNIITYSVKTHDDSKI